MDKLSKLLGYLLGIILIPVIIYWFLWHGILKNITPVGRPRTEQVQKDPEWQTARLQVESFCWMVREYENVNLRIEDFEAQGNREEMIRFADKLLDVKERGDMEAFVKHIADQTRPRLGPVK